MKDELDRIVDRLRIAGDYPHEARTILRDELEKLAARIEGKIRPCHHRDDIGHGHNGAYEESAAAIRAMWEADDDC
jgi:hypothetical protein